MSEHPYRMMPDTAFWSRSVTENFSLTSLVSGNEPVLTETDRVMSVGSCFASHLVTWIEAAGLTYVRTEPPHDSFRDLPENLGYRGFSAAYGNLYTPRQILQLLERCLGTFVPEEDRWHINGQVIDPFRPGLRYPALSDGEFDALTRQHLDATLAAFRQATVLVVTLGLTEAWAYRNDGAVYPAVPGAIAGTFDPAKYEFVNYTYAQVEDDLTRFILLLRTQNPEIRIVLTVSPVPLVATATGDHVLVATTYSKSVLRAAAGAVENALTLTRYFPAYEIITGPQSPYDYMEEDRRNVSEKGVSAVMTTLLESSSLPTSAPRRNENPVNIRPETSVLSALITMAECEEVMLEG